MINLALPLNHKSQIPNIKQITLIKIQTDSLGIPGLGY
jgi:hypothetical protein